MSDPTRSATNDVGATHVALPVNDLDRSIDFYERFASMRVVHRRADPPSNRGVAWLSDLTRPFVLVFITAPEADGALTGWAHLGVGVESRDEVDRLVALARSEQRAVQGPTDSGYPVGYWAFIEDPDGNNLEISFGQEVGLTVEEHASGGNLAP
ncbi:MAG: VOC family protein [Acidimicrobiia bacterium]|nr:VOC family protein [Acidimicrobiia bacterium]